MISQNPQSTKLPVKANVRYAAVLRMIWYSASAEMAATRVDRGRTNEEAARDGRAAQAVDGEVAGGVLLGELVERAYDARRAGGGTSDKYRYRHRYRRYRDRYRPETTD